MVQYETLDDCARIIASIGEGCEIAKCDIQDAFRIIQVHQDDYKYLGFVWDNSFWFETALPMGSSISCNSFEQLTCAIQWILVHKLGVKHVTHMIDDFMLFGRPGTHECRNYLHSK